MKSSIKKRVLAVVLCMVLMLSTGISTMADGEVAAGTPAPESGASQEPAAASVEGEAVEGEQTPAEQSTETQEETSTEPSAAESKDEPAADTNSVSGVTELVGGNGTQNEASEQEPETDPTEQESEIVSEATELKQEFTDEAGNVTQRVIANIPEGAFQASASEITMEVDYLDEAAENHIKELMTAALPENEILGDYILYDIKFKVNGEVTEPQKAIAITFEGSGLHMEDTKKANVFYLYPADPEVQDDKDEIVEITQKSEMIENLQNAGQSVENIDEYDLSEISVKEDGTADQILMEGRISTVYGCYVEEFPKPVQTLTYEDDDVVVNVKAYTEDAIPAGASLKVVPIRADNKETEEQYREVKEQLDKKAENEEYDIAGFLAYDITFVNENGEEIEPNGYVKVTMEYKEEVIPEGVETSKDENFGVTVMHLEENETGNVKDVVDIVADTNKEAIIETTEGAKVKKAEFETDSFSSFVITWTTGSDIWKKTAKVTVHYVDENGNEILDVQQADITGSLVSNSPITLSEYIKDIEGYDYAWTTVNHWYGSPVQQLRYYNVSDLNYIQYRNATTGSDNWKNWLTMKNKHTVTGNIYIVYTKKASGGGEEEKPQELGTPEHHKTIRKNEDGDYTLSLDVKGEVGKATPIDILLIIDKSGSMEEGGRINNVNTAINTLLRTLKRTDTQDTEIRLAAVTFSSDSNLKGKSDTDDSQSTNGDAWLGKDWTSLEKIGVTDATNDFFTLGLAKGGTNWQAGIKMGENTFKDRADTKRYVLFLTDGDPTYRIGTVSNESTLAGTTLGTGTGDPNPYKNFSAAVNEWKNSPNLYNATKYIIDANPDNDNKCDELATLVRGVELSGSDADTMATNFKKIAEGILKPAYTNVVINDTLSEYTDFAFDKNAETISGGRTCHPEIKVYSTSASDEKKQLVEYEEYTVTVMDYDKKQISVSILNGAKLEDKVKYSVEFNVIPSKKAAAEYLEKGNYDVSGDEDTDAPDNDTSSTKPGFYSNDRATVEYHENDSKKHADYAKPVIQIDVISRSVEKQWIGPSTDSVTMNLAARVTIGGTTQTLSYIKPSNAKLSETGKWKYTWENLPKYHYYIDSETHEDKRVEIKYVIGEENVEGYDATIPSEEEQKNDELTIIVNSKKAYWKIIKVSSSKNEQGIHPVLEGAEFTLSDAGTEKVKYKGESTEDGFVDWKDTNGGSINSEQIEAGTYILQESKSPNGYAVSSEKWTLVFSSKGAAPSITKLTESGSTEVQKAESVSEDGVTTYTYTFENTPVYSLPSTGGSGIFVYMVGSVLLMMAASLLLYKNKSREVLER